MSQNKRTSNSSLLREYIEHEPMPPVRVEMRDKHDYKEIIKDDIKNKKKTIYDFFPYRNRDGSIFYHCFELEHKSMNNGGEIKFTFDEEEFSKLILNAS